MVELDTSVRKTKSPYLALKHSVDGCFWWGMEVVLADKNRKSEAAQIRVESEISRKIGGLSVAGSQSRQDQS